MNSQPEWTEKEGMNSQQQRNLRKEQRYLVRILLNFESLFGYV